MAVFTVLMGRADLGFLLGSRVRKQGFLPCRINGNH